MENDWSQDIESVLDSMRINCILLSKEHKKNYFYLKIISRYFRIPIIIIGCINSVISIGFQKYMKQDTISIISCVLSLFCSIIVTVELYLAIETQTEMDKESSKDYYLLSIDIQKTLILSRDKRPLPAKDYLEAKFAEYKKLFENSNILKKRIKDQLTPIEINEKISVISLDSISSETKV